jgi:hypothetical protein
MTAFINFLIRRRIDRRQYRIAMPILILTGIGGWLLVQWSYAHAEAVLVRMFGMASVIAAVVLSLWTVFRRMSDTGVLILWFVGISVGGRLAQAAVRIAGGSRNHADAALGAVIVMILLALGCAPSQREPSPEPESDEDIEAEASL